MPKLKAIYEKQEEIPTGFEDMYVENSGKFTLDLSNIEGVKGLGDFNKVNGALVNERNDHKKTKELLLSLKQAIGGDENFTVDDAAGFYTELQHAREAGKGKMTDEERKELQALRQERAKMEREIKKLTGEMVGVTGERDTLRKEKVSGVIREALRAAAKEAKVKDVAIEDIVEIGMSRFELTDDLNVVARGNGATVKDWILDQQPRRPHWWDENQSGTGKKGGTGGGSRIPWDKMDLDQRGELMKRDPNAAIAAARAANDTLFLRSNGIA